MEILKLSPAFKDYLWGGTRLRDDFQKKCDFDKIAESWELSCHKDGLTSITGGEYDGITLADYIQKKGMAVLGENAKKFEDFPILIKLIDAKDNLSVQVHPDNEYAMKNEGGYGKTEMWYVVDCEEGAELIYGFKRYVTKDEFKKNIENNTLMDIVNRVPVKKGDVFFIEAGTLHAIGKGMLIAEIQQSSNTTYRVYDYGRIGAGGIPRELHIQKALDVTNLNKSTDQKTWPEEKCDGFIKKRLSTCEYFTVYSVKTSKKSCFKTDDNSFVSLLFLSGEGKIKASDGSVCHTFKKGDSFFIPADEGKFEVSENCEFLITLIEK